MTDKVFLVTGNKISSFISDENSLKFSSKKYETVSDFKEAWNKKISLATKFEIKYDSIRSIRKEDNDETIFIKYQSRIGIPVTGEFSFLDGTEYEVFFNFLEKQLYFNRTYETLAPFHAVKNYCIGLISIIGFTIFSYYQAIDIANGTAEKASSGRVRTFNYFLRFLGAKGVIAVGVLIAYFLLYKIWTRFF